MLYRNYDPQRDKDAVRRIWTETGWLEKGKEECQDLMISAGRALVSELDGQAECLVLTCPGAMRYLTEDIPACCVTAVTTSRLARRQGLAKRLTAAAIAQDAAEGALVAALGIFDQGFYDQLGFGTCGYELETAIDPATLRIPVRARRPRRLGIEDFEAVHQARLARRRRHGAMSLLPSVITREALLGSSNGFGFGYFDGPDGSLSHCLWVSTKEVGNGPYSVRFMAYSTREQFLELMALLTGLDDQVKLVSIAEPPGIQLQDFIEQPFRNRRVRADGKFAMGTHAFAYYQVRICDVAGCLARTHLPNETVHFNLHLSDPVGHYLDETQAWRGVAGDYVVTLGPSSGAEKGRNAALPTLTASVNAFTRLWLGVLPAWGLTVGSDLAGPAELVEALESALLLPQPRMDWEF